MTPLVLTIDVAHPPRHPDKVEDELLYACTTVRDSPGLRVLKVIHGHGSSGRGGSTRDVVRNWVYRHRRKFKTVIAGEHYSLLDASTQELRKTVGDYRDGDLNRANPGITIVWVKQVADDGKHLILKRCSFFDRKNWLRREKAADLRT